MNIQPGERVDFVFAVPADKLAQRGRIGLEIEGHCKCGGNLVRGRKPSTFMCRNSHWYNRKEHAYLVVMGPGLVQIGSKVMPIAPR